jgi:hypothetical protein
MAARRPRWGLTSGVNGWSWSVERLALASALSRPRMPPAPLRRWRADDPSR